jgi:predicted Zn-dependent protease
MRLYRFIFVSLALVSIGCAERPREKAITLINATAIDASLLERVRAFAEKELHVLVKADENSTLAGKADFQALKKTAERIRTDADVILIVLSGFNKEEKHLAVYPEIRMAVVNVQPLYTDDAEIFARRIERQVMRGAAFAIDLPPTPDPFCVTRNYRSLDDLDSMGRNFSPPWQERFAKESAALGLSSLQVPLDAAVRKK